jgi:CxxC motif-containing protein (DUF1111 family)
MKRLFILSIILITAILSCKKITPKLPKEEEILDGPIAGLSNEEQDQFLKGDIGFNEVFAPQNGLGPLFVSNSCASCHPVDGKGHPFTALTRFGQTDNTGNQFLLQGGPQLQNRAIPGYSPEVIPNGATSSKILAPASAGLGYLDAVSDQDIIAMSDPLDADADGISGTVNWINIPAYCPVRQNALISNGKHIGRFGRKGAAYDLLQQTANAYNQDMGINSTFEPIDTYRKLPVEPEVSNVVLQDVVFYLKTIKAPKQRDPENSDVKAGKDLFMSIGCNKCHRSELKTGPSPIKALSEVTFHPYTDMLLHNMGPKLDDNYTEGSAATFEWKTPALWGLGLSKNSQGGSYFLMHDGRARSINEAILMHGGEAVQVIINYEKLYDIERNQLIKFLESL